MQNDKCHNTARGAGRGGGQKYAKKFYKLFLSIETTSCLLSGSKHSRYSPPVLTVKRLFKAKNTGQTPIYISGFEIEGQPCEAHGFKVLNCDPFTIEPSQSVDVDIAFTPDFTLSKVTRTLTLHTSLSPDKRQINFTLQATVPAHMLFVCASVLPRPSWEPYLFYIINTFMVFILICVLITSVMEAERILKITVGVPLQARTHLLDLRRVAEEVDHDMRLRLTNGIEDDVNKSSAPNPSSTTAPKPVEKKLLLSRLASRSLNLLVMPFSVSIGFVRKSLNFVKKSVFVFGRKRKELVSSNEDFDNEMEVNDLDDEDEEEDDDEEDVVDEEDDIEDGDDEGEEDVVSTAPTSEGGHRNGPIQQNGKTSTMLNSNAAESSRQHRSRRRGRQNHANWRQKAGVEFLAGGSDDPCDSSSTCTESSVVEEESQIETGNGKNSTSGNRINGSQRNKKNNHINNNNNRTSGLIKENSNAHSNNTSEANINANNSTNNSKSNTTTNPVNNSKKDKLNKKSGTAAATAQIQSQVSVAKSQTEDQSSKLANASSIKNSSIEPVKKPATASKISAKTPAPLPVNVVPQQAQVVKKPLVKQQAKVKPSEKPPRLSLKSYSESEDRAENGTISMSPGPSTGGGSIFDTSSSVTSPAPLAPLSEAQKQKSKITPVGKILPEIKKPENLGAQFGPVGAKPPTLMTAPRPVRKSTWSDSPAEPRPVMSSGNLSSGNIVGTNSLNGRMDSAAATMFRNTPVDSMLPSTSMATSTEIEFNLRYQQQQQQQQQAFTVQQQQQRLLNIDDITGGLGISSGLMESGGRLSRTGAANNSSPTHSSLMQALQYERRQRQEEFFSQHQPEWPGFGAQLPTESYLENLWDTPPTDLPADPLASGGRGASSSLRSGWGTFSSIWPTSLWSTSVGLEPSSSLLAPTSPVEPLPTYTSRLSNPLQDQNEFNPIASVWGESPRRQTQQQQQQQQQQQYQQQQLSQGLNPSWSSTLFSNHPHQE